MLYVALRETTLTALGLVAATVVSFVALDTVGDHDWFGAAHYAPTLGLDARRASTGDLPLVWNANVDDARARTIRDLERLRAPATRDGAERALVARGSAALPVVMAHLDALPADARFAALRALSAGSRVLTGDETAPVPARPGDDGAALAWWQRFYAARELDFRPGYASRQAERLATRESRNAAERVARLGTYALPNLVDALGVARSPEAVARVVGALSDATGVPMRLGAAPTAADATRVTEAWKAFWFARHLEYETLTPWQRTLGHVTETRYGQWLVRALRGRLGVSRVTGRPVSLELRERLPVSSFTSGLGGLVAVAGVIAFGGGPAMRRRALRTKLTDLVGALAPGLVAFAAAWWVLLRVTSRSDALRTAAELFSGVGAVRSLASVAGCAALASLWLRRPKLRVVLHAVRVEAERWTSERLEPTNLDLVRHAARIGAASLLAPMGLAAPAVLLASLVVEVLFGLDGMGALTLRAAQALDAPWLMVGVTTVVPLLLARRWAVGVLAWLLNVRAATPRHSPDAPPAPPPTAPLHSPPSA